MELRTFVAETLKQIVEGVNQAQIDLKDSGAVVNPKNTHILEGTPYIQQNGFRTAQVIDFNVTLTETESTQAGASIGVFFGSVGIGAHGKTESGNNAVNSVKFSVPIALPTKFCPA